MARSIASCFGLTLYRVEANTVPSEALILYHRSRWRFRPAVDADLPAILRLYDDAVTWMNSRGITDQWGTVPVSERPHLVAEIRGYLTSGTVAEDESGEPVGFIAVEWPVTVDATLDAKTPPAAYIHSLVARRTLDARGVGAALLAHAEEGARQHGLFALRMAKWENNPKLVAYYRSLGFLPGPLPPGESQPGILEKAWV